MRTLVEAVRREPAIRVVDRTFALDLLIEDGRVAGAVALAPDGRRVHYRAPAVVLATGGAGQLFLYTTNPREATADGLAMAARAGALLVDLEFVQFHPTALAPRGGGGRPGRAARVGRPPASADRGSARRGAVLVDDQGTRFMAGEHPDRELAPRDVVARAIWRRRAAGRRVFLDARQAVGEHFPERFPTVFAALPAAWRRPAPRDDAGGVGGALPHGRRGGRCQRPHIARPSLYQACGEGGGDQRARRQPAWPAARSSRRWCSAPRWRRICWRTRDQRRAVRGAAGLASRPLFQAALSGSEAPCPRMDGGCAARQSQVQPRAGQASPRQCLADPLRRR